MTEPSNGRPADDIKVNHGEFDSFHDRHNGGRARVMLFSADAMTTRVDHLEVSLSLENFPLPGGFSRPFPPETSKIGLLDARTEGERHALKTVYEAFITGDDPYLEVGELGQLADEQGLNANRLRHELGGLGFAGLLGVVRSRENFEIEMVECTSAGLEAYCRNYLGERFEFLLCEVARRITRGVTEDATLREALPWESGLLRTHAVETLAADHWVTLSEDHFPGGNDWRIIAVSPELHAWVGAERSATPSVWTMKVAEPEPVAVAA